MTSYPRYTYDEESKELLLGGRVIGHVAKRARVVRGAKGDRGTLADGTRKHFWTATPLQRQGAWWRPGDGATIGTRFATAQEACDALALWEVNYRPDPRQPFWRDTLLVQAWRRERKRTWGF
jgi:hypothetical protein